MSADVPRLAIVAALPEELAPLVERLGRARRSARGGLEAHTGILSGVPVVVGRAGDGPRAAARGAADLLLRHDVRALVGIGVAGALVPSLQEGQLVAAREVTDESGAALCADATLLAAALAAGCIDGRLLTTPRLLASSAEKRVALGAREGYWAADMESFSWACAARERSVPFLAVRSVSDAADEELPAFLARCVGPDGGGVDRARVARMALTRPGAMPRLLALRRRVVAAAERLAAVVELLVRSVPARRTAEAVR